MNDCPFCDASAGRSEFAGTEEFAALYNIAPIVPGHSLVIPRRHVKRVADLQEGEFCSFWQFAQSVTQFLLAAFKTDAYDWTIQEQEIAGQTVPHLHLHVIPRVPDDFEEPGDWYPKLRSGRIVDHAHEVLDSNDRVRLTEKQQAEVAGELHGKWQEWRSGRPV